MRISITLWDNHWITREYRQHWKFKFWRRIPHTHICPEKDYTRYHDVEVGYCDRCFQQMTRVVGQ